MWWTTGQKTKKTQTDGGRGGQCYMYLYGCSHTKKFHLYSSFSVLPSFSMYLLYVTVVWYSRWLVWKISLQITVMTAMSKTIALMLHVFHTVHGVWVQSINCVCCFCVNIRERNKRREALKKNHEHGDSFKICGDFRIQSLYYHHLKILLYWSCSILVNLDQQNKILQTKYYIVMYTHWPLY